MRRAGHMPGAGRTAALARIMGMPAGPGQVVRDARVSGPPGPGQVVMGQEPGEDASSPLGDVPPPRPLPSWGAIVVGGAVGLGIQWVLHYTGARLGKLPPTDAKKAGKGGVYLTLGFLGVAVALKVAAGR